MTTETRLSFEGTKRAMAEGAKYIPGGASSDYRLGEGALVLERGEGPFLFDVDGNRLIDYFCGAGPIILGHNPPELVEIMTRQLTKGVILGGETEDEYEAARLMTELVPCAEMVRFANTGSEAVALAFRIARAATEREVVVKFEGHYHGWFDPVFVGLPTPRRRHDRQRPPGHAAGQDPSAVTHTEVLPWNDLQAVEDRLARGDVAAVITEPLWRGYISPAPGYLAGLREITRRHNVVLIFDEIVSGFRVGAGGGQQLFGVTPDLATFAKALANGFPIGAVAGKRELMALIGGGPVVHPGTYNGNALVTAAARGTLSILGRGDAYENIERAGGRLIAGFASLLRERGIRGIVQGVPGSFNVHLGSDDPVSTFADTAALDGAATAKLVMALQVRGIRAISGGHFYTNAAHTDELVDETLNAFEDALPDLN